MRFQKIFTKEVFLMNRSSLIFILAVMVIAILVSAQPAQAQMQVQWNGSFVKIGSEMIPVDISSSIVAVKSDFQMQESYWGDLYPAIKEKMIGEWFSRTSKMPKSRVNLGHLVFFNVDGISAKDIKRMQLIKGTNPDGLDCRFVADYGYSRWFAPGEFRIGGNYLKSHMEFFYKKKLYVVDIPIISWRGTTSTEFSEYLFLREPAQNAVEDASFCEAYLEGFENPRDNGKNLSFLQSQEVRIGLKNSEQAREQANAVRQKVMLATSSGDIKDEDIVWLPQPEQLLARQKREKMACREKALEIVARATRSCEISDAVIFSLEGEEREAAIRTKNALIKVEREAAEKTEAERLTVEKAAADKAATEKKAAEDKAAKAAAEKKAADEKAAADKLAAEKKAADEKATEERTAAAKDAAEKDALVGEGATKRAAETAAKHRAETSLAGKFLIVPIYWDKDVSKGTKVLIQEHRTSGEIVDHYLSVDACVGWHYKSSACPQGGWYVFNDVKADYFRLDVAFQYGSDLRVVIGSSDQPVFALKGAKIEIVRKGGGR